jgi:SNF2 family DNA or RNA helicase
MGSIQENDPFLWDTETLSRELCSQGRPWVKNPAALAAKLADEEVDGSTLLTYEFLMSRNELMECLNMTTARTKAGLAEAILSLQARSRHFRAWKKNWLKNKSMLSDDEKVGVKYEFSPITPVELCSGPAPTTNVDGISAQSEPQGVVEAHLKNDPITEPLDSVLLESDGDYPMQMNGVTDHTTKVDSASVTESPLSQTAHNPPPTQLSEERSFKRRRLAPTNLSATSLADSNSLSLTQLQTFQFVETTKKPDDGGKPPIIEIPSEYAYIGDRVLDSEIVLSHIGSPDPPWINLGEGGFAVVSSNHTKPPGQRLAIYRMLRTYLLKNSRKQATFKRGFIPLQSPANPDEGVFDLDGLPDSWDEETQREVDEEKTENAAKERELAHNLPTERVEAILKDEMAIMETKWKETKLPRYQRKAYQFWKDTKRKDKTKKKIFKTQRDIEHLEQRIRKIYAEILSDSWQKEGELRAQATTIKQSLQDKLYSIWLIALLEQRDPPPKPLGISKPKLSAAKVPLGPFGEEILTSEDEDEFIVPDDDHEMVMTVEEAFENIPHSPLLRHNREASHPLSEVDASMVVDLTQIESSEKPKDSEATIEYIDLTISPMKRRWEDHTPLFIKEESSTTIISIEEAPPMDQMGSLEKIGENSVKHWAQVKDRWRLVLCLLWKLLQARRERVLRLIQENEAEEAWQASIDFYQKNPFTQESDIGKEETKTTAFDLTKLFLSYSQCRQCTDGRVMILDKKDKNRIKHAKEFFPAFHAFIREWTSKFPQSSQIYRTDAFDDEIEQDNLDEQPLNVTESPLKARNRVAKEIVQNKEGVDLREREKKRVEEQEARRTKLRAALATSNAMTQDESRLIINESKQDDQSFIYVNDEIGRRIKDHQINGVRFLWNQITLGTEPRQGCLLAHTMGLGKTMQVITCLVALAEAAASDDESIKAQVPMDLRKSQSLILCPAGLVDNWIDEILMWSPLDLLGKLFKVESVQKKTEQHSAIKDWDRDGGVLVIGHDLFKKNWAANEDIQQILANTANIVICDEAHVMKNRETQLHRVYQDFRTRSRIALTGSPLSNSVKEYYSMINWIAPGYLGPLEEFKAIYADPIEAGLESDSNGYEKRKALKLLEVLKMIVEPKVQRATIQCVRHELPAKYEFVLFVKPTPLQEKLYDLYLDQVVPSKKRLFNVVSQLGLICNHPRCFKELILNEKAAPKSSGKAQRLVESRKDDDEEDDENEAVDGPTKIPSTMISTVLKETNGVDIANPALSQKIVLLLVVLDEARAAGDKVLVFSESIPTLNYLEELFKQQGRAVRRLDGSTAVSKRQDMVKAFNTGKQEIYLISTKAGGVGLNIFGANRVVIFDFGWNPVNEQQAVGRSYRFGQKKTVYVYRFLLAGTFEEELQNKSVFKMQLASRVVDKKNPVRWGKRNGDLLQPRTTRPARDLGLFVGRDRVLDKLIEHSKTSGVIRQIVSTDTFEEEDITNELTADERKDAQELHDLERLKYTDPNKYRQMWDRKQRREQIEATAEAARLYAPPPSTPKTAPNLAQPQANRPTLIIPGVSFQPGPNAIALSLSQTQPAAIASTSSQVSRNT